LRDRVHPDDRDAFLRQVRESHETREPCEITYRLRFPDGRVKWVLQRAETRFGDDGAPRVTRGTTQDITERVQAEQAMRESEAKFRAIAEATPAPALISRRSDSTILFANAAAGRALGMAPDKMVGHSAQYIWRDNPEGRDQLLRTLDIEGQIRDRVVRVPLTGREQRWVLFSAQLLEVEGEEAIFASFSDITERREIEERLRFTQVTLDHAGDAVLVIDEHGVFTYTNASCQGLLGFTGEDLAERRIWDIDHDVDPDMWGQTWQRILDRGPTTFESVYARADGHQVPVEVTTTKVTYAGRDLVCSFARDVSQRKQAEEALAASERRFRSMIQYAPAAVMLKDSEGRVQLVNPAFERLFRLSAEEVVGKTTNDLFDRERADRLVALDEQIQQTGESVEYDVDVPIAGGEVRHTHLVKFPIFDIDGTVSGIGNVSLDITDQKDMERQLRQAQKMEAVGQLTGGIAHDFNNLLAIINGNAELLADLSEGDGGDARHLVQPILRATQRGAELTHRLLSFSRQQTLIPQAVDAADLITGMTGLLDRTLGETVTVETNSEPDLWPVWVDAGQLENALLNMAINARDAMPDGGALSIDCANECLHDELLTNEGTIEAGDYVRLAVSDTGCGMTEDVLARAIEPFFTTKGVGQGSGLGLSMVYGFAKQSGGYVTLDSMIDQGTTVTLYLPRARHEAAAKESRQDDTEPRGCGETILVIEDDPDVRKLTVNMLAGLGYTVIDVENAAAARAHVDNGHGIDLVLSDVVLTGGMNGIAFAEEIRRHKADSKILFMSGYTADIADAAQPDKPLLPHTMVLNKPFRKYQLAKAVRDTLDG
jgi:two-component system CheB/CheR fusion protein